MKYLDLLSKHGSKRAAARAIGVDESTIRRRIEKEMKENPSQAAPKRDNLTALALEKQLERESKEKEKLSQELNKLLNLKDSVVPVPEWGIRKSLSTSSLLPVLFCSDMHCGEVIRPEDVDGLNQYNVEIFRERYQTLIDKTIDLSFNHTGAK